jgi:hypothetical protein
MVCREPEIDGRIYQKSEGKVSSRCGGINQHLPLDMLGVLTDNVIVDGYQQQQNHHVHGVESCLGHFMKHSQYIVYIYIM